MVSREGSPGRPGPPAGGGPLAGRGSGSIGGDSSDMLESLPAEHSGISADTLGPHPTDAPARSGRRAVWVVAAAPGRPRTVYHHVTSAAASAAVSAAAPPPPPTSREGGRGRRAGPPNPSPPGGAPSHRSVVARTGHTPPPRARDRWERIQPGGVEPVRRDHPDTKDSPGSSGYEGFTLSISSLFGSDGSDGSVARMSPTGVTRIRGSFVPVEGLEQGYGIGAAVMPSEPRTRLWQGLEQGYGIGAAVMASEPRTRLWQGLEQGYAIGAATRASAWSALPSSGAPRVLRALRHPERLAPARPGQSTLAPGPRISCQRLQTPPEARQSAASCLRSRIRRACRRVSLGRVALADQGAGKASPPQMGLRDIGARLGWGAGGPSLSLPPVAITALPP